MISMDFMVLNCDQAVDSNSPLFHGLLMFIVHFCRSSVFIYSRCMEAEHTFPNKKQAILVATASYAIDMYIFPPLSQLGVLHQNCGPVKCLSNTGCQISKLITTVT